MTARNIASSIRQRLLNNARQNKRLFNELLHLQLDIGFGDIVYPEPERIPFPVVLDSAEPVLLCYSRESTIAEKLHAIVKLGMINSRMKDFYDIWLLSRQFSFDRTVLKQAIEVTFRERHSVMPESTVAFTDEFCTAKQVQWAAFRKRLGQDTIPESFSDVVYAVRDFSRWVLSPK